MMEHQSTLEEWDALDKNGELGEPGARGGKGAPRPTDSGLSSLLASLTRGKGGPHRSAVSSQGKGKGGISRSWVGKGKDEVHDGVSCDECGMSPIVGPRWKRGSDNWDLCQEHYDQVCIILPTRS